MRAKTVRLVTSAQKAKSALLEGMHGTAYRWLDHTSGNWVHFTRFTWTTESAKLAGLQVDLFSCPGAPASDINPGILVLVIQQVSLSLGMTKSKQPSPLCILLDAMREKWAAGDVDGAVALARVAAPYLHPRYSVPQVETVVANALGAAPPF